MKMEGVIRDKFTSQTEGPNLRGILHCLQSEVLTHILATY